MPDADGWITEAETELMGLSPEQGGVCGWCAAPLAGDPDAEDQGQPAGRPLTERQPDGTYLVVGYASTPTHDWRCGKCVRGESEGLMR
jgi:hypothetical protein